MPLGKDAVPAVFFYVAVHWKKTSAVKAFPGNMIYRYMERCERV